MHAACRDDGSPVSTYFNSLTICHCKYRYPQSHLNIFLFLSTALYTGICLSLSPIIAAKNKLAPYTCTNPSPVSHHRMSIYITKNGVIA